MSSTTSVLAILSDDPSRLEIRIRALSWGYRQIHPFEPLNPDRIVGRLSFRGRFSCCEIENNSHAPFLGESGLH